MTIAGELLWAEVERMALARLAGCRREATRKTRFHPGSDYAAALEAELRSATLGSAPLQPLLALLAAVRAAEQVGMEPPLGGGMHPWPEQKPDVSLNNQINSTCSRRSRMSDVCIPAADAASIPAGAAVTGEGHTPGPWLRDGSFHDQCRVEFSGGGHYVTISATDRDGPVAFVIGDPDAYWRDDAETEANARLISAAPDLLEASPDLSSVIAWLENGCDPKHAATELRIYQARIEAARAKATTASSMGKGDE